MGAELADALYAVESDPGCNPFAVDVAPTLHALADNGCQVAVLSDIHFDVRPAFAAAALAVDVFRAGETLMVGDRASHDGAAVHLGMPVLLLPPLLDVTDRRLHHVTALAVTPSPGPGSRIGVRGTPTPGS